MSDGDDGIIGGAQQYLKPDKYAVERPPVPPTCGIMPQKLGPCPQVQMLHLICQLRPLLQRDERL
jgi:hypothetical protein